MVQYFVSCVRRIIGPVLHDAGFTELLESDTRLTFGRGDVVLSLAYHAEDLPEPWVAVDVGLAEQNGFNLFGVWRVIPSSADAADYPTWRFSNEATLEAALARYVGDVLDPYVLDLCADREKIVRTLARQAAGVEDLYLVNQREADLKRARRAFDDGSFQAAVDAYAMVAPGALSASDRRRQFLARKHVST